MAGQSGSAAERLYVERLYLLILTDIELSYDDYLEDFYIGFFEMEQEAIETAEYYLHNVKGFCDFPCKYRILPKEIEGIPEIANRNEIDRIWLIQGWDVNENLDEVHMVESNCFVTKEGAEKGLSAMREHCVRDEWAVSCWTVGERGWREGFCRMVNGRSIN